MTIDEVVSLIRLFRDNGNAVLKREVANRLFPDSEKKTVSQTLRDE